MTLGLSPSLAAPARGLSDAACRWIEAALLPILAILAGFAAFALFLAVQGHSPAEFASLVWRGGFGTAFSLANTLQRAAPLFLTALCVALPAQLGLVVIGGEGAFVLGGLAAAAAGATLAGIAPVAGIAAMALAGALAGGLWIGLAGWLRHARGVNETISSLLLSYIAIALFNHVVEGPLRDPASLNKPSTAPIPAEFRIGTLPGIDVHWGFAVGVLACVLSAFVIRRTTFGFAARIAGGNPRAAAVQGLPVGRLVVAFAVAGGAAAGVAGMVDMAAVQGSANASLIAGTGYTGILVAFLARQNPLAIVPMAILVGGIAAAGGLVQRRMGLPDATMLVLQGCLFLSILLSETLAGRLVPKALRAEGVGR
ncbi:ABC transporter permease [Aureimonas jatrophae]|uniref:Nucleoside ABC transporter membrane protein n=1 Tax=Aureimonas jatrophae TaxID=1166073 RepID=A0A1H0DHK6_9HYPH|nr:ABC transporter permease [Aureimonas jatrophae]MBB3951895.1 simple sugar transport system permease protein [Aureimonas jatrophae]SDN69640.1 nucleoside ABC transporter membrane protein [Aureimonas jatrophae]